MKCWKDEDLAMKAFKVLKIVVLVLVCAAVMSYVVMQLWNWLMPAWIRSSRSLFASAEAIAAAQASERRSSRCGESRIPTNPGSEIDNRREYRYGQHKYQPVHVVAGQEACEMHDQNNNGEDVVEDEKHFILRGRQASRNTTGEYR